MRTPLSLRRGIVAAAIAGVAVLAGPAVAASAATATPQTPGYLVLCSDGNYGSYVYVPVLGQRTKVVPPATATTSCRAEPKTSRWTCTRTTAGTSVRPSTTAWPVRRSEPLVPPINRTSTPTTADVSRRGARNIHRAPPAPVDTCALSALLSSLIGPPWSRSIQYGFGRTGDRQTIALLARPSRSSVSSARSDGPGHPIGNRAMRRRAPLNERPAVVSRNRQVLPHW